MAEEKGTNTDWLTGHLAFLRGLKSPSDTQKLLLLLAAKTRTTAEERTFSAIVKSEKAQERAKKAQAEVASLLATEAAAERKARTHKLIQLGLLFSYAELDESPRDFLAGLLLLGASMPEQERQKLSELGADLLAKKEPKKGKKAPASPPAAPAAPAQTPQSAPAPAPTQRPAPAPAAAEAPAKPLIADTDMLLKTEFTDRDEVKNLGAKWNAEHKKWYVPAGMDNRPFMKWIQV